jgi:hypothetical protein
VKKWIVTALLLILVGVGVYVYVGIQQGGEAARAYEVEEMSAAQIAEALRSPELTQRLDAVAQLDKLNAAQRKAAFLDALRATHPAARLTALSELRKGREADAEVVTAVLAVAQEDPDADVVDSAFELLVESGDPRVLTVAAARLLSTDASLSAKLVAARTLDTLTGRTTSKAFSDHYSAAEECADDLGMAWDDWLGEHASRLKWNPERKRFE